jgi:glycerol-3-phosphate dehydrogenase
VRSAAAAGAVVANYAEVVAFVHGSGARATGLEIVDRSGDAARRCCVQARVIVNAAGPWADRVRQLEDLHSAPQLVLTKGIHLVLSRERLPIRNTVNLKAADNRGLFAIPRGEMAYLGTTDTFYPRPEYWPRVDTDDIDYVLDTANRAFDVAPLCRADVVNLWAGLRPLLAQPGKRPSEISRRDEIITGRGGVITISGGKLTAYRRMAARVVDRCQQSLEIAVTPSPTAEAPLPGGDFSGGVEALVHRITARLGDRRRAERLVRLYGTEAGDVAELGANVTAEVHQAVLREGAVMLEDYWVRRSARARFDPDGGLAALNDAATAMAALLGWSDARRAAQLEHCARMRESEMSIIGSAN